jgi:hypothetical protein
MLHASSVKPVRPSPMNVFRSTCPNRTDHAVELGTFGRELTAAEQPGAPLCGHRSTIRKRSHIWLVTFKQYDLDYFDDETCRLEPIDKSVWARKCYPSARPP